MTLFMSISEEGNQKKNYGKLICSLSIVLAIFGIIGIIGMMAYSSCNKANEDFTKQVKDGIKIEAGETEQEKKEIEKAIQGEIFYLVFDNENNELKILTPKSEDNLKQKVIDNIKVAKEKKTLDTSVKSVFQEGKCEMQIILDKECMKNLKIDVKKGTFLSLGKHIWTRNFLVTENLLNKMRTYLKNTETKKESFVIVKKDKETVHLYMFEDDNGKVNVTESKFTFRKDDKEITAEESLKFLMFNFMKKGGKKGPQLNAQGNILTTEIEEKKGGDKVGDNTNNTGIEEEKKNEGKEKDKNDGEENVANPDTNVPAPKENEDTTKKEDSSDENKTESINDGFSSVNDTTVGTEGNDEGETLEKNQENLTAEVTTEGGSKP